MARLYRTGQNRGSREIGNIMKILVLEDDPDRTYRFCNMFVGHAIVVTPDADIAIKLLNEEKYDIIFLDHDLGGHYMVHSEATTEKTGYTVAKEIDKTENRTTPVVIHSFNYDGAKNIEGVLARRNVLRATFGSFDKTILNKMIGA